MSQSLVFLVGDLPFLFQGGNQFLLFIFVHQELCTIQFSFILNLHFSYELILIFDFLFDCLEISRYFTIVLFLQIVFITTAWKLWCGQNIFNCIWYDEVFIWDKTHNWFFINLWYCDFFSSLSIKFVCYRIKKIKLGKFIS